MDSARTFVFAGGGTGGHLFPALAIIEWLRDHQADVSCEFLCTNRPIDRQVLSKWNVPFNLQDVQPLRHSPLGALRFYRAWRRTLSQCLSLFKQARPTVVVGVGGFGSGPAVRAAARLRIPVALLNPDAVPGKANRYLARAAKVIFVQWRESARCFPESANVVAAGCPVRSEFYDPGSQRDYATFDLAPKRKTLLITGASSGARAINETLIKLAPQLSQVVGWQILHISGAADAAQVEQAYGRFQVPARVVSFTDKMAGALRIADLALARAGAVTLAELAVTSTPAILMPYPFHRDNHQTANANIIVKKGAAIIVPDAKDAPTNAERLQDVLLPLMRDSQVLSRMSAAYGARTVPSSAETVTRHLLELGISNPS